MTEKLFSWQLRHWLEKWPKKTSIAPEDIVSVIISTTTDIKSAFPAKAVRSIEGWTYVPVMCTHEMDVPGAMPFCIRILMHVNSSIVQKKFIIFIKMKQLSFVQIYKNSLLVLYRRDKHAVEKSIKRYETLYTR